MAIFHVKEVVIVLKYKTIIAILARKMPDFSEKGGWFLVERWLVSRRKVAGFSEKGATFLLESRQQNHKYTIILVMI